MGIKANIRKQSIVHKGTRIVKENEFSHVLKKMSVFVTTKGCTDPILMMFLWMALTWNVCKAREMTGYLKGAPERVLECCTHYMSAPDISPVALTQKFTKKVMAQNEKLASNGLVRSCFTLWMESVADTSLGLQRVLALAYRTGVSPPTQLSLKKTPRETMEKDFVFLGLVGIYDPPRAQSLPAVLTCYNAGIAVHMATGDQPATAISIAKKIAILDANDPGTEPGGKAIAAADFDAMTDAELDALPEVPRVVARCSPQSKVKLIEALHRRDKFVVMTGDGSFAVFELKLINWLLLFNRCKWCSRPQKGRCRSCHGPNWLWCDSWSGRHCTDWR